MTTVLLDASLRAVVLGGLVWCLLKLLRITAPSRERTAWLLVLVASVLMPVIALARRDVAVPSAPSIVAPAALRDALVTARDVVGAAHPWSDDLLRVGGLLYLMIAAALLLRIAVGVLRATQLWRTSTVVGGCTVASRDVRCSPRVSAPVAIGHGILLPSDWPQWTAPTLAAVLAHEASHASRHDFHWQLLSRVYCAAFWGNPFSWWLLRRLTILGEHVSDEAAVSAVRDAPGYADMLVAFARRSRPAAIHVAMARQSLLARRVQWILRRNSATSGTHKFTTRWVAGLAGALALGVALPEIVWMAPHGTPFVAVEPSGHKVDAVRPDTAIDASQGARASASKPRPPLTSPRSAHTPIVTPRARTLAPLSPLSPLPSLATSLPRLS
jgi:beta-lactamase regulating signal transducer with metallopeptidase domain